MKKSLIALAALSAFATAAQAQSSVTVYGKVDAGFSDRKAEGTSGAAAKGQSFVFNAHETSRFGLRGTEDLGGGLKANFVIETQLGDDNANSAATLQGTAPVSDEALGGRAMWVGVSGNNFGEIRVGFQNAFSKDYVAGFSSSGGSNVIGDPTMAAGRAVEKTAKLGLLDSRYNGLSYASPSISGFTVKAMIVSDKQDSDNTTAATKDVTGQEFAVQYSAGAFAAAVAYGSYEINGTTLATNLSVTAADSTTVQKQDLMSVYASYDLGAAKLFAKYGNVESKQNGGSATTDAEATATVVGVRVPFGNTTLIANYAKGDYESVSGTTKYDDSGYQLGLEHALSKRSKVYAIYGKTDTDISATTKEKDTQFAVGLVHNF